MRILVIIALATLAAACGRDAGYPEEYRFNFLQACEAQQAVQGLCACVWERIEAEVPRAEFDAAEAMTPEARVASPLQQQITNYALECGAQLSP
jgi:hypothetical protein